MLAKVLLVGNADSKLVEATFAIVEMVALG